MRVSGGPANGMIKLQSLLLSCTTKVLNQPFLDFVSQEDRDRFLAYMKQETESIRIAEPASEHAQSIHVHLQGEYDLRSPVQIFCCVLLECQGDLMYLLGIREDVSAEAGGVASTQQNEADIRGEQQHQTGRGASAMLSIPEASVIGIRTELNRMKQISVA